MIKYKLFPDYTAMTDSLITERAEKKILISTEGVSRGMLIAWGRTFRIEEGQACIPTRIIDSTETNVQIYDEISGKLWSCGKLIYSEGYAAPMPPSVYETLIEMKNRLSEEIAKNNILAEKLSKLEEKINGYKII